MKDLDELPIEGLEGKALDKALAQREEEKDYEVLDELPYWFNGRGFINKKRTWAVLVKPGTDEAQILSPKYMAAFGNQPGSHEDRNRRS